jgi:hypothetical protein
LRVRGGVATRKEGQKQLHMVAHDIDRQTDRYGYRDRQTDTNRQSRPDRQTDLLLGEGAAGDLLGANAAHGRACAGDVGWKEEEGEGEEEEEREEEEREEREGQGEEEEEE